MAGTGRHLGTRITHEAIDEMVHANNNWVVVAIPSDDAYVWKISSEKVPHLTMLHLDGSGLDSKIFKITEFIQHVVDTSLCRFNLSVDRRGILGADEADVLFFNKDYVTKNLEKIRHFLLTNDDLNKAYHSVEQFPSWMPHLTLGYPDSPAKDDARDRPGLHWIEFDRIALWNGDYEGPEFRLKSYSGSEVAMSDSNINILEHHGIKGMKWGIRRSKSELAKAHKDPPSDDAAAARATIEKIKANRGKTDSLSNKELQNLLERVNLEQRYSKVQEETGRVSKGEKKVKQLLGHARTIQDIYSLINGPLGKEIRKALTNS